MKKIAIATIAILFTISASAQEISLFGGASYIDNGVKPLIGVSYGDQIGHSERFGFEVSAAGMMREYGPKAISAGQQYASMRMMGMVKCSLLNLTEFAVYADSAPRAKKHTINLVAGFGVELSKDDYKLVYGDENFEGEYPVNYTGCTPVVSAGMEYKFTFKGGNSISIKALADYGKTVFYDKHLPRWGATVAISYGFAL